ncbi:LysR family transcriptional regulator [Streptomyces spectabilis]|uniref:DNA-binding transcriptional LysR family regulator n=1 Tax=Streptomyces spectabilis TaxID=68270 RepID=A0A5P2X0V9_STRST|nr:LysR family transcriptional regulator [Streptomyces spectabilis]MBB5108415.1 DNA-binding transcriptional LysR family regulator [Streptomyces spectabilis]MCI3901167.1 LysR family transcriptional regulator [Streptomyces spectabilis]QEV58657.1 LysR family transcriptional regulator [Streptomyces spectabilis]GGV46374.1 LysR family transcriptional regulator [Streptomyces spectabilis]
MELRQLQYFAAVADEGGFSRAAERLGIVQSAVSQQVRRLERELGVRLFRRTTRHVELTGAGERLLPEARAVLAAARRTRQVAADLAAGGAPLRLGTVQGPGDRIQRLLADLAAAAPGLPVRLRRLGLAERLAAVRSGELDAALVRAAATAPGLELLPVWSDPLYVALPAAHRLAGSSALRVEQLGELPLRLAPREQNPPFHDLVTGALRAAGAEPPLGPPFTTLQETLAEIGAGAPSWTVFYEVAGVPSFPRVAVRPLAAPAVTTYVAMPPGAPGPALRRLLEVLPAR